MLAAVLSLRQASARSPHMRHCARRLLGLSHREVEGALHFHFETRFSSAPYTFVNLPQAHSHLPTVYYVQNEAVSR